MFDEGKWDKSCSNAISFKSIQNYEKKNQVDNHENSTKNIIKKSKNIKKKKTKNVQLKKNTSLKIIENNIDKNKLFIKNSTSKISLAEKLRENLKGSRFRFINEQLYTSTGANAKDLFENDPEAFEAYHEGYNSQLKQWPLNPLNRIIKAIKKMPINYVIADFGCGEGRLSESVPHKVYSIDLVSCRDDVISCDMANTPLHSNSIDVAVYCLSLMGTNIFDFILEANRVLRMGGIIHIAEIVSRFNNINEFFKTMKCGGFELLKKDSTNKLFYFFIFKKTECVDKNLKKEIKFSLKPCLYKKR